MEEKRQLKLTMKNPLAAKVAGTALAKFPMPMIDLEKLIKNAETK